MKLKDEPDVTIAKLDQIRIGEPRQVGLADANLAAVDPVEAAQHMHQRALPYPGGPDDGHHLARLNREVETAKHVEPPAGRGIRLRKARDLEEAHW